MWHPELICVGASGGRMLTTVCQDLFATASSPFRAEAGIPGAPKEELWWNPSNLLTKKRGIRLQRCIQLSQACFPLFKYPLTLNKSMINAGLAVSNVLFYGLLIFAVAAALCWQILQSNILICHISCLIGVDSLSVEACQLAASWCSSHLDVNIQLKHLLSKNSFCVHISLAKGTKTQRLKGVLTIRNPPLPKWLT